MIPVEPNYPTIAGLKYFKRTEAQEKEPKTNYMKMTERSLKRKRINPFKESWNTKPGRKRKKSFKEAREKQKFGGNK